jgi:hypothetical protein
MKVRFIKGDKAGTIEEVDNKRASYWQRMGLVEEVHEVTEKPVKSAKSKKKSA